MWAQVSPPSMIGRNTYLRAIVMRAIGAAYWQQSGSASGAAAAAR